MTSEISDLENPRENAFFNIQTNFEKKGRHVA